jgi:hypothetical protein
MREILCILCRMMNPHVSGHFCLHRMPMPAQDAPGLHRMRHRLHRMSFQVYPLVNGSCTGCTG